MQRGDYFKSNDGTIYILCLARIGNGELSGLVNILNGNRYKEFEKVRDCDNLTKIEKNILGIDKLQPATIQDAIEFLKLY